MSGFEGREKEIADAIRAKLRERGIGRAEIREIAASRAFHRKDDSSVGGGGQRCREQYCDAFSDDPVLGPVIGHPDVEHSSKVMLGKAENALSSPCGLDHGQTCVAAGDYCAYDCVTDHDFNVLSITCPAVTPGGEVYCSDQQHGFHCLDFECPSQFGGCHNGGHVDFECDRVYMVYDLTCATGYVCASGHGRRFQCGTKGGTTGGFHCGHDPFSCDTPSYFSCFENHSCLNDHTCSEQSGRFNCASNFMCAEPTNSVVCVQSFICGPRQSNFDGCDSENFHCEEGHFICMEAAYEG